MNILIVEDNLIIAENIKEALQEYDFKVFDIATCFEDAINILKKEQVDIALLDINLSGVDEGISIGQYIQQHFQIPFIYTTAFSDIETIEKAKETLPHAYLVKPINTATLFATIQMAFQQYLVKSNNNVNTKQEIEHKLFVKLGNKIEQISWHDVYLITAYKNYVGVKTKHKEHLVRCSLLHLLENIIPTTFQNTFIQVNRKQAIKKDCITKILNNEIIYNEEKIQIGISYRKNVSEILSFN